MFPRTLAIILVVAAPCFAQESAQQTPSKNVEFRIENQVFVGDSDSPTTSNLTLFQKGLVLDFRYADAVDQIKEIAIFDTRDRSFVLLDVKRRLRLKIDSLQLLRVLDGMRKELEASPKFAYLLFEEANEQFDDQKQFISVASDRIRYEVNGSRPADDMVLAQYLRFLENYTLLGVADPTRMPPFARMRLNRAIRKYGLLPNSVALTIFDEDGGNPQQIAKSKHQLGAHLTEADQKLIDQAQKSWMEFKQVGLSEYRSIEVAGGSADSIPVKK